MSKNSDRDFWSVQPKEKLLRVGVDAQRLEIEIFTGAELRGF
jgi:hypothetical protein